MHLYVCAGVLKLPFALGYVPLSGDEGQAEVLVGGLDDDVGVMAKVVQGFALLTRAIETFMSRKGRLRVT